MDKILLSSVIMWKTNGLSTLKTEIDVDLCKLGNASQKLKILLTIPGEKP